MSWDSTKVINPNLREAFDHEQKMYETGHSNYWIPFGEEETDEKNLQNLLTSLIRDLRARIDYLE